MNEHPLAMAKAAADDDGRAGFLRDVVTGLSAQPKTLKPKYFYDDAGSRLFQEITALPEYYPTRTELRILDEHGRDIAAWLPPGAALIEFGAGATTKIRRLLTTAKIAAYVPIDISGNFLAEQAGPLRQDFPDLAVLPLAADIMAPVTLPPQIMAMPRAGFFPGSTLGNFDPHEASDFLRRVRAILGRGAPFIIGVDLDKDPEVLRAAYNDSAGVTARFNLNLLRRINRELGGNFDLTAFAHRAIYNRERSRVEMHLVSLRPQSMKIGGRSFTFRMGESIHTENSHKFSVGRLQALARGAGFSPQAVFTDPERLFSVHVLKAT